MQEYGHCSRVIDSTIPIFSSCRCSPSAKERLKASSQPTTALLCQPPTLLYSLSAASIFTSMPSCSLLVSRCLARYDLFASLLTHAECAGFVQSYEYIFLRAPNNWFKKYELAGIAFFYAWFSACLYTIDAGSPIKSWALRAAFVLTALATTAPIHVQIVLVSRCKRLLRIFLIPVRCF